MLNSNQIFLTDAIKNSISKAETSKGSNHDQLPSVCPGKSVNAYASERREINNSMESNTDRVNSGAFDNLYRELIHRYLSLLFQL